MVAPALSPQSLALSIARVEMREREDPVGRASCTPKQAEMIRLVTQELETLYRGGNNSAKTTGGALLFTALAQGRKELCGIPLPRLKQPTTFWVLSREYKQQRDSVQPPYERWLGEWPHEKSYVNRSKGWLEQIAVRYEGCHHDDPQAWSRIVFVSQHHQSADTTSTGRGVKIDGWHSDEPGEEPVIRELRKARIAGRPFFRLHTLTPLARAEWEYLRKDFEGTEDGPVGNRAQVIASIYDNQIGNGGFLTPAEIADYIDSFKGDAYFDVGGLSARLYGDWIDLSGKNPFRMLMEQLRRWERECEEPKIEAIEIIGEEDTEDGRLRIPFVVDVEIYEKARFDERYYISADPSLGVDDEAHDPCGLHVYGRDPFRLMARYNGYCGAYGLGTLAAMLGERYNHALVDPDMTGGYGGPTLTALDQFVSKRHPDGYHAINKDRVQEKSGAWRSTLGFTWNEDNKAEAIEQIRNALRLDSVRVRSRGVVECLKQAVMDDRQRLVKPAGVHYEDLCNLGRAIQVVRPHMVAKTYKTPEQTAEEIFDRALGIRPSRAAQRRKPALKWR